MVGPKIAYAKVSGLKSQRFLKYLNMYSAVSLVITILMETPRADI